MRSSGRECRDSPSSSPDWESEWEVAGEVGASVLVLVLVLELGKFALSVSTTRSRRRRVVGVASAADGPEDGEVGVEEGGRDREIVGTARSPGLLSTATDRPPVHTANRCPRDVAWVVAICLRRGRASSADARRSSVAVARSSNSLRLVLPGGACCVEDSKFLTCVAAAVAVCLPAWVCACACVPRCIVSRTDCFADTTQNSVRTHAERGTERQRAPAVAAGAAGAAADSGAERMRNLSRKSAAGAGGSADEEDVGEEDGGNGRRHNVTVTELSGAMTAVVGDAR